MSHAQKSMRNVVVQKHMNNVDVVNGPINVFRLDGERECSITSPHQKIDFSLINQRRTDYHWSLLLKKLSNACKYSNRSSSAQFLLIVIASYTMQQ